MKFGLFTSLFWLVLSTVSVAETHAPSLADTRWKAMEALKPTAPENLDEERINRILNNNKVCRFYYAEGNHVEDGKVFINGEVVNSSRIGAVADSEELLKSCRRILNEHGPQYCAAIEFAGHAHMQSIGMADTLGIDIWGKKKQVLPEDPNLMEEIASCLQGVSFPHSPVIFTTCGAVRREGILKFYPNKQLAQDELATILGRPVISALGPCRGNGYGAECTEGWYCTNPKKVDEHLKSQFYQPNTSNLSSSQGE